MDNPKNEPKNEKHPVMTYLTPTELAELDRLTIQLGRVSRAAAVRYLILHA